MKLVFATNNSHKLNEIRQLLNNKISVLSLSDIGCKEEIQETGKTLEENAIIKARYVFEKYKVDCFADDTGLEIEALNGKPGVYSARYAGEEQNAEKNIQQVLAELKNNNKRNALFKTIILLIINNKYYKFYGEIKGCILHERRGTNGFGYDPIFKPVGYQKTLAEMTPEEKNMISHRSVAIKKFYDFLYEHFLKNESLSKLHR